jgi:hypothetical protein
VLIALNPDTEPGVRSLSALVARLLAEPGVALVVPRAVGLIPQHVRIMILGPRAS